MKTRLNRLLTLSLLLAATFLLPYEGRADAYERDDESITAMIKLELWTAPGVSSMDIYVDTLDGNVVLSGKVDTASEREIAEKVANTIGGVKGVRNLLQVVPRREEKSVALSDADIESRVKRAFSSERALKGTHIVVASVNNALVLLKGDAVTFSEHLVAIETARLVAGVRSVATQVKSPQELGNDEIAGRKALRAGRDVFITSAVKLRLFADPAVPALDVNVDSRYGMVVLFGTVPTEAAKAAAGRDARAVRGVDRVVNDLQVVPSAERKQVAASDEVVKQSVERSLAARDEMKRVDVAVKNAVVRLTGAVGSVPAKLRATVLARATPGAGSVRNDLRIAPL